MSNNFQDINDFPDINESPNMKVPSDDMDELEQLFGDESPEIDHGEKVVLQQNLEGFASCFPDWDLHPPVD